MGRWGHWAIAAACVALPTWLGCGKGPSSGRYCDVKDNSECVWVDLDHDLVTFYDDGKPVDVAGRYLDGLIDTFPQTGKYAGKMVRLSFDTENPSQFELHVNGPTDQDRDRARYMRIR